jgi:hypothetical protein
MRALWYFDIEVRSSSMKEGMMQSLPVMARLIRNLHGYFGQHPDKFAIAFPRLRMGEFRHPGNVIRIFTEIRDNFDGLVEWVKNNSRVAPYITKSFPQSVDEKNITGWMEYRRYRIPSRGSRLLQCRDNRIKSSEEVPYLRIASNYEVFSMHISASEGIKTDRCNPTSYGLSGKNRFSLPVLK